jgi:uncharacterized protein YndB with AHSA1/START domain
VVFTRELPHPPEQVWEALVDPQRLRDWSPFDADRNLGSTGPATLTMAGGGEEDQPSSIEVRRADAPRVLEYTWDEDLLRWELEPGANGTRLTLRHTVAERDWLARVAAGWHICIAVMDRALAGDPVGRIVGEDAKPYWQPLHEAYTQQLSL